MRGIREDFSENSRDLKDEQESTRGEWKRESQKEKIASAKALRP